MAQPTQQDKVRKILEAIGEKGISSEDIAKQLRTKKDSVFDAVHKLRKKLNQEGLNIENKQGLYFMSSLKASPKKKKSSKNSSSDHKDLSDELNTIRKKKSEFEMIDNLYRNINTLPERRREDFLDLLIKATVNLEFAQVYYNVHTKFNESKYYE